MRLPDIYNGKPLVHAWFYNDQDGELLGAVARYQNDEGKKDVVPFFKPDGKGGLAMGIDRDIRPLFGLYPLANRNKDKRVFIVEGEKCASALQSIGCCAVTSQGGSGAAKQADWTPLSGVKHICILPDNDEAGEHYAQDVYNALMALPSPPENINLLRLTSLPDAGDFVDWVQSRVTDWDGYNPIPENFRDPLRQALKEELKNAVVVPDSWGTPNTAPTHPPVRTPVNVIQDDSILVLDFPEFDSAHYYGIAGELSALAVEDSEADRMAVYMSFLTVSAAALGRDKFIHIGETKHYARLFTVLVGASSRARKGTSFKPVERIFREAQITFANQLHIATGGLSSAEGLIYQVRDESEKVDKKGVPEWEGVDDKRLLVVEEELGNVLKQCQRDGNTLSATLRRAWDGGTLAPMTKNNKLTATNPHINVLGHITQFELKCLMSESDINNGLANRFLWVCVRRTKKLAYPKAMNDSKVNAIAERLSKAIAWSTSDEEVTLSPAATHYWNVKYHEVSQDKFGIIGAITSRAEANVMRLSLLFCLLDCTTQIEQQHIEAAIHLINFCNESAKYIFTAPSECEAGSDADKLLKALNEKPMTQTEISRLFSGHKSRRELAALLNELLGMNKVQQEKEEGSKKVVWMKK